MKGGRQRCPGEGGGSLSDAVGVKARSGSLGEAFSLLTQVSIFISSPCSAQGGHRSSLPDVWGPLLQLEDSPGWSSPLAQEHVWVVGDNKNGDSWEAVP